MHKRVGIFGGTFDPIHNGHLIVAREAAEKLRLDQVIFVPAGCPPHKKGSRISPAMDRCRMVQLAVKGSKLFAVSDLELRSDYPSYTVDTLQSFKNLNRSARLYLLVGADQAGLFSTWKEPERLFKLAEVCVLSRPGFIFEDIEKRWVSRAKKIGVSGIGITATGIRKRVRMGKSVEFLLPEAVRRYIIKKRLYR